MRENLGPSLELMFGDEGGYVNAKTDAGGPTNWGITHKTLAAHRGVRSVTADQVRTMKRSEAEEIYRSSYWGPSGGDVLPIGLDYAAFDAGVMSGPQRAVKLLQRALGLKEDGWIGPATLGAVASFPGGVVALIRAYCDTRMAFLRSLKGKRGFPSNGRGWTIRVTGVDPDGKYKRQPGVVGDAISMVHRDPVKKTKTPDMSTAVENAAGAKAEPGMLDAYLKPDVLLPAGGGVVTAAGTVLTSGLDPIRLALAIAIIVIVGLGAFYAFRRIRATS